ncbi:hypothetical protein CO168_01965 [Candidatus Shapirobacteria bacterium CG_4_9_14_3_um_filter_36_12]|uniref:Uncharacterized protein n=1 Tax=Candidatus Shapirobacteria bacterium CG_4_9_14_3_um_filter_36_12 TaxID=1974877 RepID=A0A2M7XN84_9BACT|nr:MAG: hypothetical protein CO168_01965 [Candidatus Shapirobacteria bacterium CG_4_9_14_3_um_filter_36_12]
MKKNILFVILFFVTCLEIVSWKLLFARPVLAVICNPVLKNCVSSTNPTQYTNNVLSAVISLFFIVGIIYFFWHLIFAGYHLIGSDGDPKKFETAKNELTYSVLGLIVIFSIFAILKFVGVVLGIQGLKSLSIKWPTL